MNMIRLHRLYLFGPLLLFFLLNGCAEEGAGADDTGGDGEIPPTVDELVQTGKDHLAQGRTNEAKDAFESALSLAPDNSQAMFGRCLATVQSWPQTVELFIGVFQVGSPGDGVAGDLGNEAGGAPRKMINTIVDQWRGEVEDLVTRLDRLKEEEGFQFQLDHFPLTIRGVLLADLHDEWDLSDVYGLSSFAQFLHGVFLLVSSHRLEEFIDYLYLIDRIIEGYSDMDDVLPELLAADENILALHELNGAALWARSVEALKGSIDDALYANQLLRSESDDQSDDVFVQNDGLTINGVQHMGLHGTFNTGVSEVLVLWDGNELSLKDTYERIRDHMNGDAGKRFRFDEDFLTIAGILFDYIRRGVGLTELLEMLGLELDPTMISVIEAIGTDTGEEFPKALISLLPTLLDFPNGALELDLHSFSSRPVSVRELFPNATVNPFTGAPVFMLSHECSRLGFVEKEFVAGDTIGVLVHDPGPAANSTAGMGNDAIEIEMTTRFYPAEGSGEPEILDREYLAMSESLEIEALFRADVSTVAAGVEEVVREDGILQVPEDSRVYARYFDRNADPEFIHRARYKDGISYDQFIFNGACEEGSARDYAHFQRSEFSEAYYIPDPPAEIEKIMLYPAIEADGIASDLAYTPMISSSLNGLLWLNMKNLLGEEAGENFSSDFVPAGPAEVNLLFQKLDKSLKSLSQ